MSDDHQDPAVQDGWWGFALFHKKGGDVMPDLASVSTAISCIKNAFDIAKTLKDSQASLHDAEAKLKFADLISALADTKIEISKLIEALDEKKQEIRELKRSIDVKEKIFVKENLYWLPSDSCNDGPFCTQCLDNNSKLIRLKPIVKGHWSCPTCKNDYYTNDFNQSKYNNFDQNLNYD